MFFRAHVGFLLFSPPFYEDLDVTGAHSVIGLICVDIVAYFHDSNILVFSWADNNVI